MYRKQVIKQTSVWNCSCLIALFIFLSSYMFMMHCTIFYFLAQQAVVKVSLKLWISWDEVEINSSPWKQELILGMQSSFYGWIEVICRCHGSRRVWRLHLLATSCCLPKRLSDLFHQVLAAQASSLYRLMRACIPLNASKLHQSSLENGFVTTKCYHDLCSHVALTKLYHQTRVNENFLEQWKI